MERTNKMKKLVCICSLLLWAVVSMGQDVSNVIGQYVDQAEVYQKIPKKRIKEIVDQAEQKKDMDAEASAFISQILDKTKTLEVLILKSKPDVIQPFVEQINSLDEKYETMVSVKQGKADVSIRTLSKRKKVREILVTVLFKDKAAIVVLLEGKYNPEDINEELFKNAIKIKKIKKQKGLLK